MGQRGALFIFLLVTCSTVQTATRSACHTRRDCDKSRDEFCKGDIVNFTLEFGMGGGSSAGIEASDGGACATCTGLERDQCRPPCKGPNAHGWQLEVTFIAVIFSLSIGVPVLLAVLALERRMVTCVSRRILVCLVEVLAPILWIVALLSVNVAGAIDHFHAKRDPFACTPDRLAFDVGLDLCVPYYFQVIAGFVKPLLSILIFPPKKKESNKDTAPQPEALKTPLLGEEARGCGKSCGDRLRSWKKEALRSPIRIIYLFLAINSFRVDFTDARSVYHSTMPPSMKAGGFLTICISSGNMTQLAAFFPLWYMGVLPNPLDLVFDWGDSKNKVVESYGTVFLIFYLFILSTYTVPLLVVILFTFVTMLAYAWFFLPIGLILYGFGLLAGLPTSRLLRKLHTYPADTFQYKVFRQVEEAKFLKAAVVDERPIVGDLVTIVQEGKLQGTQARITRDDRDGEPYKLIANVEDCEDLEFKVAIDKTTGRKLGAKVEFHGDAMEIVEVTGELFQQWNDDHPERAVKRGDLIAEVNGMKKWWTQNNVLELVVKRRGLTEGNNTVLPDIDAVLKACREAGISEKKDHYRRACVGKAVLVMEIDRGGDTAKCYVPSLGQCVWFAVRALSTPPPSVEAIKNPHADPWGDDYFKEGDVKLVKDSRSDEVQSKMWDELPRQLQELAEELVENDLHEKFFMTLKRGELGIYFIAPLFVPMLAFALPLTARWLNSYGYIESLYMTMMDRHISTYMSGAIESSERVVNMAWLLV